MPAETPVTTPVELTVESDVLLLIQVPPGAASVNDIVDPAHTVDGPVIVELLVAFALIIAQIIVIVIVIIIVQSCFHLLSFSCIVAVGVTLKLSLLLL